MSKQIETKELVDWLKDSANGSRAFYPERSNKLDAIATRLTELEKDRERLRDALGLAIHVRGTSKDTVEVLQKMEAAMEAKR